VRPLKHKRALLLIDFFNPSGFAEVPGILPALAKAAGNAASLKARMRASRVPVIYANDNFGAWTTEFPALVETCARMPGRAGAVARMLRPEQGDRSLLKPRHSAFYGTPLEFMLEELDVQSLILCGTATDACITMTAHDAHMRKFGLWVPRDCVAAKSAAITRSALAALARVTSASTEAALVGMTVGGSASRKQ